MAQRQKEVISRGAMKRELSATTTNPFRGNYRCFVEMAEPATSKLRCNTPKIRFVLGSAKR